MSSGVGFCMVTEVCVTAAVRGVARVSASWMNLYDFLGHLGKAKFPLVGFFSYGVRIGLLLLLAGCAGGDPAAILQSGRVVGIGGLEGRWAGPVSPEGAGCGSATTGLMNIGQGSFGFAPFQNTVAIRGKVGPDDTLEGTLERVGGDKQTLTITLRARVVHKADEADRIEGDLVSGRCRWAVKLMRG